MIRNQKDFFAGLLFASFGIFLCALAPGYGLGSSAEMGSGAFPFVLGIALILIGTATTLHSLRGRRISVEGLSLKPLALITLSVLFFGYAAESLGAILAIFLAAVLATFASKEFTLWSRLAVAGVITAFSTFVFIWGLGMQVPLIGSLF